MGLGLSLRIICLVLSVWSVWASASAAGSAHGRLISCLRQKRLANFTTSASSPATYNYLLNYSVQNLRFTEPGVHKPYVLIFPEKKEEVAAAVGCCIKHGWEIRVRSGGHSYEGLSSTSDSPDFAIIDLMNLDAVDVDMKSKTAWAESGATVGQLYSAIARKTARYGFPAGVCPTMGTGGHFSGGGLSFLSRKYGLAADNIIDALLVDANANLLDRESMGEDLFWGLRGGGGGGSWGVVLAWKLRLVKVPAKVTAFRLHTSGRLRVTELVHRWQSVAPLLEQDLFLRAVISGQSQADVRLTLEGLYLGPLRQLLHVAEKRFPEMGMVAADCEEMSWLDSIAYASYTNTADMATRYYPKKKYFKAKSDFVTTPIPASGLQGAWKFLEEELYGYIILTPLGGRMYDIPSIEIPFPHRLGNLYNIHYQVAWQNSSKDSQYMDWMRRFYEYMTPYVSQSPRGAYVNYLDLDLGSALNNGTSSVEEASTWGHSYFRANFQRLVQVKTKYDPNNVFRNAQSIPVNK